MATEILKNSSPLLNIPEVAKILLVQENTVRVWMSHGKIFPQQLIVRLGRRVLFHRNKLYEWIENGCKPGFMEDVHE